MNWTDLIRGGIEYNYHVTDSLMDLVNDDELDWKPANGENWMTTGQLLMHITNSCGWCCRGFVTGDWGMPEGVEMSGEDMLPPAEKLPAVGGVAEAKKLLAEDKKVALAMLEKAGEDDLANKIATAPWDNMEINLGQRFLQMIQHLQQHKGQLFYYLKLQGKPVNTQHLWGM